MTRNDAVQIGTCEKCGRPVTIGEARTMVNGLMEHVECPLVSIRPGDLGGAAA